MQAKITHKEGYRCAPNGSRVEFFACGEIVTGKVAEWAMSERAASRVFDPRTDTQEMTPPETKVTPARRGRKK